MNPPLSLVNLLWACFLVSFTSEAKGAAPREVQIYKVNGIEIRLMHDAVQHLLVSIPCLIDKNGHWDGDENCDAIKKLRIVSLRAIQRDLEGGANPGSIACLKWGGKSLVALDANSNQNSLCQFPDKSIASSGTLHYHARQNDEDNP